MKKKTMNELIEELKKDEQIEHWHEIEAKPAQTSPVPERVDDRLKKALEKRGVKELYIHQKEAFERVMDGEHVVTVTPTASGKTLCYNLPVLQSIAEDQTNRSLYLFPTKALAQDQKSELNEIIHEMDVPIHSETYDGDTSRPFGSESDKQDILSSQTQICCIQLFCLIIRNGSVYLRI